jgi:alanine dehydrogenase
LSGLRYLSASDIAALGFSDAELLAAVERGFLAHGKGEASIEPRLPLSRIADGFVVQRASLLSDAKVGVRVLGNFPANDALGLSVEPSLLALFSATDGYPLVLVETSRLAPMRTGASAALAARHLARRNPRVLGHLGAGSIAYWNIRMLDGLFHFDEIRLHSKHPQSRDRLAERLREDLKREVRVTDNWRATVEDADIVVEATRLAQPEPLLKTQWLKRGTCLIPYGSQSALDLSIVDVADKIVVDDWARAVMGPVGALRLHIDSGRLTRDTLHAELGEIVAGVKPGRERDDEIVVYWQRSLAVADLALATALMEKAERLGIGHSLPFG